METLQYKCSSNNKIIMNTQEHARQLMAQERQQQEHLQDNLLTRACEEVEDQTNGEELEKARELMTQNRQKQEHLQNNLLARASEEIK